MCAKSGGRATRRNKRAVLLRGGIRDPDSRSVTSSTNVGANNGKDNLLLGHWGKERERIKEENNPSPTSKDPPAKTGFTQTCVTPSRQKRKRGPRSSTLPDTKDAKTTRGTRAKPWKKKTQTESPYQRNVLVVDREEIDVRVTFKVPG